MPTYRDTFPGQNLVDAVRADADLSEQEWSYLRSKATAYQRRVALMLVDPSCAPHGEASTYSNYACRCAPCTAAYSKDRTAKRVNADFDEPTPPQAADRVQEVQAATLRRALENGTITDKGRAWLADYDAEAVI